MSLSPRTRPALPALLALAAAGASLCPQPARAVILRTGGSAERDAAIAAEARKLGQDLKGVAALVVCSEAGTITASATYLGPAADGRTGLLLTSGHTFQGRFGTPEFVNIAFGATIGMGEGCLQLPATRVVVHPDYRVRTDGVIQGAEGKRIQVPVVDHDLAMVEFDLTRWNKQLEALEVQAIPLYEGTGYTAPLREAMLAGFGQFGHAGGGQLAMAGQLHAGHTHVSHATLNGQTAFHSWLPAAEGKVDPMTRDPQSWFTLESKQKEYGRLDGKDSILVRTHAKQAAGSTGDSGGPLLFNTRGGVLRLAGVFSTSRAEGLTDKETGKDAVVIRQTFESVPDHLDWIRAIQAGKVGKSKVYDLDAPDGSETKVEAKSDAADPKA